MKNVLLTVIILMVVFSAKSQTILSGNYKIIDIGDNGYGDYTRSLILLHEIYNGINIEHNFSSGTITAMRGNSVAGNRQNIVQVNTSSSYNGTVGSLTSYDDFNTPWKLKTCLYNEKKYLAVDVPYVAAYHNWGFKFSGATFSTGDNMKCVSYEVSGQPVNQNLISNIQDFSSNMAETHDVTSLTITGNLGVGIHNPLEKLAVNGKIRAHEIKVETANWPDYVFSTSYPLPTLLETEKHIKEKGHLPGIPSAEEVKANGINVGEMNAKLLQKIEELTLYLIELKRDNDFQRKTNEVQNNKINKLEEIIRDKLK
jgi:hypothetical protein